METESFEILYPFRCDENYNFGGKIMNDIITIFLC